METNYTDSVELTVLVSTEEEKAVTAEIVGGDQWKSRISRGKECWFAEVEKELKVWDVV